MARAFWACPRAISTPARPSCRRRCARGARRPAWRSSSYSRSARCATGTAAAGAPFRRRSSSTCSAIWAGIRPTTTTRSRTRAGWSSPRRSGHSPMRASARWSVARSRRWLDSLQPVQVLNFYSTIFADELKRGRKTATIRLGDKSDKYRKNQLVLVTIGYQYSPRERIFEAVIDQVEVMQLADLSPRDIKHDNPEFRRHEELINFLEQIYDKPVSTQDIVTVVRFSQILENPSGMTAAMKGFGGAQN